ncbi:MAG TPA: GNAT family N-acetyltransferase [Anaerolineales bacterium]
MAGVTFPITEEFRLRSGLAAKVRPIRPDDAPRLQDLLQRLSAESIFFRILAYRRHLTEKESRCLTQLDYRTRMAFVATLEQEEELVIAVARYAIVSPDQADTAEVGIVVEDRYQNQGLGSYLIRLLIDYAREQGIRAFSGTVSLQNQRILRFITRSGLPAERKLYQGVWEICVDLQGTDGNL